MGKISKAILMLNYLNTGNKYTIDELALKLGVSGRMVRYYKDELEKSGIYIESFKGPNGGYFLLNSASTYNHFNKYDIQLLDRALSELKINGFEYVDKFKILVDKIKELTTIEDEKNKFIPDVDGDDRTEIIDLLKNYINNKDNIKILYKDIGGKWIERTIYPLQIFKYNNSMYVTAYCKLRNDIRHFEINRIKINK